MKRAKSVEADRASRQVPEFVRACLRYHLGTGSLPDLQQRTADPAFDARRVYEYACRQRVAPLLHTLSDAVQFPAELARDLRRAYIATAQTNLYLLNEFAEVLQTFAARNLSVVVAKGVLLIEQLYQNPALRPLADLDIYVRQGEAPIAMDCLRRSGFHSFPEPYPGAALEFEKELLFIRPGLAPIQVDLHWSLLGSTYHREWVSQDWIWESTIPAQVRGVSVRSWSPEISFLHLASHLLLSHASDNNLLWWYDLAMFVHKNQAALRWDLVGEYARRLQVILPVRESLNGLSSQWGVAIPPEIQVRLQALQPTPQEARVYAWHSQPNRSNAQRVWEVICSLRGARRRVRYFLRRLLPNPAYLRAVLGVQKPMIALYPMYWGRGLKMIFSSLVNRLRR